MNEHTATATTKIENSGEGLLHRGSIWSIIIVALVAIGSAIALAADTRWIYLLVYAWFGLIYGLLLQYGRFCMASAVRDLFAVQVPRMAVGIMIATALFSLTAALVTVSGTSTFYPHPLGWHIIIGGLIFGFGMIFTGGCASGSLYKSGEGNVGSMLVVASISFSQALFVDLGSWSNTFAPKSWAESAADKGMPQELSVTDGWFDQFMTGYIWDLSGGTVGQWLDSGNQWIDAFIGNAFLSAILPVLVLVLLLYIFAYRKGYLRRHKQDTPGMGFELRGIWAMITSSKNTALAGIGLGVFAGLHMWVTGSLREHYRIFNFGELLEKMGHTSGLSIQGTVFDPGYWYITTQEAQLGGWVLNKAGVENMDNVYFGLNNGLPSPEINAPLLMSAGIILGAAVLALARREFKWKIPDMETAIFAIVGGAIMGIGARIGMGCNVGAFFAAVTNGDLTGWLFLAGMVIGGYIGVRTFNKWLMYRMSRNDDLEL
ncbi:YeeE/YedE family protein [Thiohalophilus sp.]|uniref:YeeE/YedE family protein n=1 Tax=Thiohalophilus sp. TaxID=3028392 RepID=UPI002ACE9824|nr:YeeE/YedE family protein [Thiohalophilus sp.]MDZ7802484.1 YeeE/YedE family protein [Thiohalophilus sp.]